MAKGKIIRLFQNDTFALIGYGSQGYGQGLNLRDNGLNVIIGVRKGSSWEAAVEDGWVPGENLFEVDEAISRGTIIMDLLSDAAQSETWSHIKPQLTEGKTLYFSHGFSPVFKDLTHVEPPSNIDVILAAQKVLVELSDLYLKKVEVSTPHTLSGTMLPVKLKKKLLPWPLLLVLVMFTRPLSKKSTPIYMVNVVCLMGGIHGMFLAQYEVLRENGHTPSEAFNETVEEATQSLYPLIGKYGMDYMYDACSTTARRGALDWYPRFKDALKPVFEELYESVKNGSETKRSLEFNSRSDYKERLEEELQTIRNMEIWSW